MHQILCLQAGGREALQVCAALTGTDYNVDGVANAGGIRAHNLVSAMLKAFNELRGIAAGQETDAGFLEWAAQRFTSSDSAYDDLIVAKGAPKKKETGTQLKNAREHDSEFYPGGGKGFAHELRSTAAVFEHQRTQARGAIRQLSRQQLQWTGENMRHGDFMSAMRDAGYKPVGTQAENGCDYVAQKTMTFEAERAFRVGERPAGAPLIKATSISKGKNPVEQFGCCTGALQAVSKAFRLQSFSMA